MASTAENKQGVLKGIEAICRQISKENKLDDVTLIHEDEKDTLSLSTPNYTFEIILYAEPVESSFFTVRVVVCDILNNQFFCYTGSEVEYEDAEHELGVIEAILKNVAIDNFSVVNERVMLFFNNTYMVISLPESSQDAIYLLKTTP